jgi:glycosyltransferase involved in cell wall biosynthesis
VNAISIILPVYNSASSVEDTILQILAAVQYAEIKTYEIIVVDDGSTDKLAEVVNELIERHSLVIRLLVQENLGRMPARLNGARNASYEDIIFIDSRVHIHLSALKSLKDFFSQDSDTPCVVANINYADNLPYISYFWEGLEHLAWHKFYNSKLDIRLSEDNFNNYPKGTTTIYFKRDVFIDISYKFESKYEINHNTNDDTHLLRFFLESNSIVILREFRATYFPRKNFIPFLRHSYFRGKMAAQGYFYPKSKARKISILTLIVLLTIFIFTWKVHPVFLFLQYLLANLIVYTLAKKRKLRSRSIISIMMYEIPFSIMYLSGILRNQLRYLPRNKI